MTDIRKTLEALRKPVTGNGPELDTIDAWNNALKAASKALEGAVVGVKVKPLVWVEDEPGLWGNGLFTYTIRPGGDGYFWWRRNDTSCKVLPDEPGIEAAKAAAQADYERKIRSALEPGQTLAEAYRAGLEAAADACVDAAWKHEGSDAYSRGIDKGAFEQVKASLEAIRAQRVPSEFGGE